MAKTEAEYDPFEVDSEDHEPPRKRKRIEKEESESEQFEESEGDMEADFDQIQEEEFISAQIAE